MVDSVCGSSTWMLLVSVSGLVVSLSVCFVDVLVGGGVVLFGVVLLWLGVTEGSCVLLVCCGCESVMCSSFSLWSCVVGCCVLFVCCFVSLCCSLPMCCLVLFCSEEVLPCSCVLL